MFVRSIAWRVVSHIVIVCRSLVLVGDNSCGAAGIVTILRPATLVWCCEGETPHFDEDWLGNWISYRNAEFHMFHNNDRTVASVIVRGGRVLTTPNFHQPRWLVISRNSFLRPRKGVGRNRLYLAITSSAANHNAGAIPIKPTKLYSHRGKARFPGWDFR